MIRDLSERDIVAYETIYSHPQINPFLINERPDKDFFFSSIKTGNLIGFEKEERIIGFAGFKIGKSRSDHVAHIAILAVLPDYQRQKIGSQLMLSLEEKCKEKGVTKLWLGVFATAEAARKFYDKLGYVEEGVQEGYVRCDDQIIDRILLTKFI
jgi:putative acetyltransferase